MRYLLLDRITELAPPVARGVKCVSLSDDVFADHFPGHPVLPGALLIEAMAQLGGVLLEASERAKGHDDLHALLVLADRVKFRRLVRPGDRVELEATASASSEDGGQVRAVARVDGQLAAEAELGFALSPVEDPALRARRREVLAVWMAGLARKP